MQVRHWMQVALYLAGVLCYGFAVPTSHSLVVPLRALTRTPTPTNTPGAPVLCLPADGALVRQPVLPSGWYFSWEARAGPCNCSISVQRPGGPHVGVDDMSYCDAWRYEYRHASDTYLPSDALGPWHWQVSVSCPLGSNQSETRTFGVEEASFTACLPIILRRLAFAPPPASTVTPPPTASPTATQTPTPTATSTPIIHIVTAEGTLTRVYVSICQAGETHYLPESGVYLYSDSVSLYAYEGKYVRILGWSVPSPECQLVNVTDILELPGG